MKRKDGCKTVELVVKLKMIPDVTLKTNAEAEARRDVDKGTVSAMVSQSCSGSASLVTGA